MPGGDAGRLLDSWKEIASFLGPGYVVESSRGHIRDLPRGAADVPAKYKGQAWARLGVDVNNNFEPLYLVTPDKKATVTELKDALKQADLFTQVTVCDHSSSSGKGTEEGVAPDDRLGRDEAERGVVRSISSPVCTGGGDLHNDQPPSR